MDGNNNALYQIGIRCLAATDVSLFRLFGRLYQIGIRCLAATQIGHGELRKIISDWN